MKKVGAYLPSAYEEVVEVVNAYVLTEKVGICCMLPLNSCYVACEIGGPPHGGDADFYRLYGHETDEWGGVVDHYV